MCEVFPPRRPELDAYERDIVEMASKYPGQLFYDYHRKYSAKAAAYLTQSNIKVDWSQRDMILFIEIFSGCEQKRVLFVTPPHILSTFVIIGRVFLSSLY